MNRIHISRNRQALGQFSPEEVAEGLASGEFLPSDLAWREPMETWKPLGEFTDLPPAPRAVVAPVLPQQSGDLEISAEPAWERRRRLGTFSALVETVRQVLAAPVATFKMMKREGGQATPLFFYLLVTTFATWAAMAYQLTVIMMNPEPVLGSLAKSLSTGFASRDPGAFNGLGPAASHIGSLLCRGNFPSCLPTSWQQPAVRSFFPGLLLCRGTGFRLSLHSYLRGFLVLHCRPCPPGLRVSRSIAYRWCARDDRGDLALLVMLRVYLGSRSAHRRSCRSGRLQIIRRMGPGACWQAQ